MPLCLFDVNQPLKSRRHSRSASAAAKSYIARISGGSKSSSPRKHGYVFFDFSLWKFTIILSLGDLDDTFEPNRNRKSVCCARCFTPHHTLLVDHIWIARGPSLCYTTEASNASVTLLRQSMQVFTLLRQTVLASPPRAPTCLQVPALSNSPSHHGPCS